MKKLVIIDRDGVINFDSDEYIKSVEEWQPIPGSLEAMARLHQAGYLLAVATNQSGIARGLFNVAELKAMHQKMQSLLQQLGGKIDALVYCPHGPDDHCDCRKPKPGLLLQISQQLGVNLENAYFVGDSFKDIQAARAVNAKPILVKTGKGERSLQEHPELIHEVSIYNSLQEFTHFLLN
ncbi:MAG: D,D-heptose 1,7-bisphosphate phosphatase [Gammaproteobacteria bacterium]|jgi:D-glycero-D-manno-heptose 1,7-bisphosphate phosphatase|nr:D,D-heptose 1,7-bisphosphate phosphatase [Gammaproteobacteria bacterium]